MSIKAWREVAGIQEQPTAAGAFTEMFAKRFNEQAVGRVPRSQASWGSEQQRFGSWNTGVASFRPVGHGQGYSSGWAPPRFDFDPEEEDHK